MRRRILFTITGVFILLILLLYVAAERTAFITLQRLEDQISRQNVVRVAQTIKTELNSLVQTSMDYAKWDDTYRFIEEASHGKIDKQYEATNFSDSNMQSNRLNLLIYVNTDAKVVFQKAFNLETQHEMPVPSNFLEKSLKNLLQSVDSTTPKSGIIDSDYGLMLIAAHPILPNSGAAPNRGSLIFGRLLDAAEIKTFTTITLLPVAIYSFHDLAMLPSDVQASMASLKTIDSIVLHPISDNKISGYTPLAGVDGNPVAMLQVEMPRSIQEQGHISLNYLVTTLIALVLIFGVIVSYILEKWVLMPVSDLGRHVNYIGANADLSTRLTIKGSDELSQLTQNINQMLDALEKAQQDQRRSEARYRAIFEQASEGI
ncbi:MAG: HAMP domain-containing protein, partial [Chloroflexi bacterium]|nr:HAMP domain-containing protein [Chloroflexota bacterium]